MTESALQASRVLMGDSLGFHIIFVMIGLTLPILVCWFEYLGIRKKDKFYTDTAKFWSKIMALLVITGVISGTVIALQMSLVWPGIMKFGGEVIGLPFMFETYAFLIEAVFLALYMTTWNNKQVSKWLHWFFGIMVIVGSTLSAYAITAINGWMNLPSGFDYINGKISNVDVWQVLTSRTAIIEFVHSMPGYYLATTMLIVSLYALKLIRLPASKRKASAHKSDWLIINKLMLLAVFLFIASAVTADITGKYLAKYEPVKLAALELNYNTRTNAPLLIGGVSGPNDTIRGPHFEIPNGLSLLAGNSTNTTVIGLNSFDESQRPPLYVHTFFDIKMTLITALVVIFIGFYAIKKWNPKLIFSKFYLLPLTLLGFMGVAIVELGWMITEIGRQPWAVRGYVTTKEAVTKTHDITNFGYIFPLAYLLLFTVTILAVKKIVNDQTPKEGN